MNKLVDQSNKQYKEDKKELKKLKEKLNKVNLVEITNKEIEALRTKAEGLLNKRVRVKTRYEYIKLIHHEDGVIEFVSNESLILKVKDRNRPLVVHFVHVLSITELKIEESKKRLNQLALKEDEAELRKLKTRKAELVKERKFLSKLVPVHQI